MSAADDARPRPPENASYPSGGARRACRSPAPRARSAPPSAATSPSPSKRAGENAASALAGAGDSPSTDGESSYAPSPSMTPVLTLKSFRPRTGRAEGLGSSPLGLRAQSCLVIAQPAGPVGAKDTQRPRGAPVECAETRKAVKKSSSRVLSKNNVHYDDTVLGTTTRYGHAAPYHRRGRVHLNTNAKRRLPAFGPLYPGSVRRGQ